MLPSCGARTPSRPTRCRSRPRSPSPTTAASSRRAWTWRSSSPISAVSSAAARKRASAASFAASASPTPSSAPPPGASKPPRSGSTSRARRRCWPAASPRAKATRPSSSRSCATASASTPTRCITSRAIPIRSSWAKAPAARARPPWADRRSAIPPHRSPTKGKAIAAHLLQLDTADVNFADGVFSSPKTNRTLTIKEVAQEAMEPTRLPKDMDVGLIATATYVAPVQNFPNGCHICELEIDEETGAVEIVRYSVVDDVGTVLNPLLLKGQIVGGVAQGVGQVLMEYIRFDAEGQILTASFMDYAMPRAEEISAIDVKSNPVPTKPNPLGVKGAGEAGCVGALPAVANALV